MINRISSWFSRNNTYNQTNVETQNNYSAETQTLLNSIDGYFHDGKIIEAMNLLNSAITEHKHNESKYALLIKKTEYLLEMRNIEEAIKILNSLKKNYADYIDIKYKEHMLFIYSLKQQEHKYFELLEDIKIEKQDIKSNDYFKLLYAVNSGNIEESKKLFNLLTDDEKEEQYIIAGHIFANSYRKTLDILDLENAEKYYQKVLEKEPNFLLKIHVVGFFVQNIINTAFKTKNKFDKKQIIKYNNLLKILFKAKQYFNSNYINELINFNAFILLILEFKDEYIKFYEENEDILFNEHYLQYSALKQLELNHKLVQKHLMKSDNLLVDYASLMLEPNKQKEVLSFFTKNIKLLFKFDLSVYFYIQSSINLKYTISKKISEKINQNKLKSYEFYLSYLYLKYHNQDIITQDDIDILLEFVKSESTIYIKITETIDFLERIKKSEQYIKLAISKIKIFEDLTYYILRKCWHDKELRLDDFELLVKYIDDIKFASYIADVYFKYDKFDKAFEYFQKTWNDKQTIDNAKNLLNIGLKYYELFHSIHNEEIENEALLFLQVNKRKLDFNDIGFISFYSLVVNKDINNAFGIINKKILSLNVYELNNVEKQSLSSLYFNSIINFKDNNDDLSEKNIIYVKNNIHYLDKTIFDDIDEIYFHKFTIKLVDKTEIQKIKLDSTYEKKSLFHFIVNQILHTIDSPHFRMIKVNLSSNNPFTEIQEMLVEQSNYTEDQLLRYSDGADIGFWSLAGSYDKYFNLIVKLINDNEINFNSCHVNYKDKTVPKLLTLSSIIFLNYHNQLDQALQKENVYIQKTTYDWLCKYIEELDNQDELFSVFEKDGKLYKDIVNKEQIEHFSTRLKNIVLNIEENIIIDDTKATLPFKEAFSMSKYFGIQEYQALALSFQKKYQIITEDRIFESIFKSLNFNQSMISNSLVLIEKDELLNISIDLHKQNYKYVLNGNILKYLVEIIVKSNIVNSFTEKDIEVINIMNDYKWLDNIKKYYQNTYKVLYPKTNIPQEDYLSKNIEYLFSCVNLDNKIGFNNDN